MKIIFGRSFDQSFFPLASPQEPGLHLLGPQSFLRTLENHLGLSGYRNDIEYLRVEQFRQKLSHYLEVDETAFFKAAFHADQFATAADLLNRRDELLNAGWDFSVKPNMPSRLQVLAALEQSQPALSMGIADRIQQVQGVIANDGMVIPFEEIQHVEPWSLLSAAFQKLFSTLRGKGIHIEQVPSAEPGVSTSNLHQLQRLLSQPDSTQNTFQLDPGDDSLIILKAKRDSDLAILVAELVKRNAPLQPTLLVPDQSQTLDNAFIHTGLPGLGIKAASLGRPPLQLLKLATSFLWAPLNPFEVLEFVSLSVQPIERELAYRIGRQIAQYPGIRSDGWNQMIGQYFRSLDDQLGRGFSEQEIEEIKANYRFWFERRRYDPAGLAPKVEMVQIFDFLHRWARKLYDDSGEGNVPILVLSAYAQQIKELLEAIPEQQLSKLELERLVRTIYQPTPIEFNKKQFQSLAVVHHPHAFWGDSQQTLWWNFAEQEPDYFFSRWYQDELKFLEQEACLISGPAQKNEELNWRRLQAVLRTKDQLILVCPEMVEGKEMHPHPLLSYMETALQGLNAVSFNVDLPTERDRLQQFFDPPQTLAVASQPLGQAKAFIEVDVAQKLTTRPEETITSLETLLYYPYQWVFKYLLKLHKSPILSVVKEQTLQGNLAHRLIEFLLQEEEVLNWNKEQVYEWIAEQAADLFEKEGSVFLMYGKEPLRVGFIKKMQFSAWSLIDLIRNNDWEIQAIEGSLEGDFGSLSLKGRSDLILSRGKEFSILDLKWRGAHRRREMLKNQEDLQLILYAHLLNPNIAGIHTAYYILEKGELITRNNHAFKEVNPIAPDLDTVQTYEHILETMQKTLQWRQEQLGEGKIEIRCKDTFPVLDAYYENVLDLLEMKNEDAPFDDYRVLINLVP